jgi:DNA invertase Pin-like site-specific DNA recombinase
MNIWYARVSTEQQHLDRQVESLERFGVEKIYTEKMTGTKSDRPELTKMIEHLRPNDVIVIESLSRLGRSTKNLIELMEKFNSLGVNVVSLKENIDTTTATGKLMFTMISAFAQFERDIISERTKEEYHHGNR